MGLALNPLVPLTAELANMSGYKTVSSPYFFGQLQSTDNMGPEPALICHKAGLSKAAMPSHSQLEDG